MEELRLTSVEIVVEIDGPEQRSMQGFEIARLRIDLAMPVRIAAGTGDLFLNVDAAWPEQP